MTEVARHDSLFGIEPVNFTLPDMRKLFRSDPETYHHYLDVCGDRLNFLHLVFGFDFHELRKGVPDRK